MLDLWLLVIAASLATYLWRGLGVLLSGRIAVAGELFNWVACVAYAMVAGLIARILILPTGMIAETALTDRLVACALALVAYHLSRRNLLVAVSVGVGVIMAVTAWRGG